MWSTGSITPNQYQGPRVPEVSGPNAVDRATHRRTRWSPMKRLWSAMAGVVLLAACLPTPSPSPTASNASAPSPTASASPQPSQVLIAVLQPGNPDILPMLNDTVLIVSVDGGVNAKATFTPRKAPFIPDAAALLQPEARVASGKVYYQDRAGAIRSLAPGGAVTEVTSFALTSPQQILSFAVSPDGARLMATRLTLPPVGSLDPASGRPRWASVPFKIEVLVSAGNTVTTVRENSFTVNDGQLGPVGGFLLSMVGWGSGGPLATTDTMLATQAALMGRRWYGRATHLDLSGQPGALLGGSDCWAWAALDDGTVLCSNQNQSVANLRSSTGTTLNALPASDPFRYGYLTLAPGGGGFTYADLECTAPAVMTVGGAMTALPTGFCPQGWLDAQTVIGTLTGLGHLATVHVGQPTAHDLGVGGLFVGTL
jgi:hypothetical protein